LDAFMHGNVLETRRAPLEKPQNMVGPPTTMSYPASAEIRQAGDFVGVRPRMREFLLNGLRQFRRDTLVGINGQYPLAAGQIKRAVLLSAKSGPVCQRDLGTVAFSNFPCLISAARVDHNDLVGKAHGLQASCNVCSFVLGNDNDR